MKMLDVSDMLAAAETLTTERISVSLSAFDHLPVDYSSILQNRLDLVDRHRTSLFPWRGQFSPEFIEVMLAEHTCPDSVVADPFAGSGTTLFEAARRCLTCFGAEINPAAVAMASMAHFVNLGLDERKEHIASAQSILEEHVPIQYMGGLFSLLQGQSGGTPPVEEILKAILDKASPKPYLYDLMVNVIIRFMASGTGKSVEGLFSALREIRAIIEELPYSGNPCMIFHCDAREMPLEGGSVDVVITSPPYINVFNYHQNNRQAMELMGWDMLRVAKSEIGSNRKNRGNRFLTVVQYTIDMLQALQEMRRIVRPTGRIIIVVGRESNVRGVSFQNGRIVAALATGGADLQLRLRQERKFKNKFGEMIYEDILHFVPAMGGPLASSDFARRLAQQVLTEAACKTGDDVRSDVLAAIQRAPKVQPSPCFRHRLTLKEGYGGHTSPRQAGCGPVEP